MRYSLQEALNIVQEVNLSQGFRLGLSYNDIGTKGATAFAKALVQAEHLPRGFVLDLYYNEFGDDGVKAFAEAFVKAKNLPQGFELDLHANDFQDKGNTALVNALIKAEYLPEHFSLDLGENAMHDEGVTVFAEVLQQAKHLPQGFKLSLSRNKIDVKGAQALAGALEYSEQLPQDFKLDLSGNDIGAEGAKIFALHFTICPISQHCYSPLFFFERGPRVMKRHTPVTVTCDIDAGMMAQREAFRGGVLSQIVALFCARNRCNEKKLGVLKGVPDEMLHMIIASLFDIYVHDGNFSVLMHHDAGGLSVAEEHQSCASQIEASLFGSTRLSLDDTALQAKDKECSI